MQDIDPRSAVLEPDEFAERVEFEPSHREVASAPRREGRALKRAKRRVLLFGTLTMSIGFIGSLLAIEVAVRVLPIGADLFHRPCAKFGHELIPAKQGRFSNSADGGARTVKINSLGLRDHETTFAKPGDVFRVLVLGDSYPEGLQVELDEGFPQRLEQQLASTNGKRIEVINSGVSGYGTDNELLYYRSRGRAFSPDVVVLCFFMNDLEDNSVVLQRRSGAVEYEPYFTLESVGLEEHPSPGRSWQTALHQALRQRWKTYQLVSHRLLSAWQSTRDAEANAGLPGMFPIHLAEDDAEHAAAWELTERLIEQLRSEVEADGRRFMLLVQTCSWQVHPEDTAWFESQFPAIAKSRWDWPKPNRRLSRFAQREGFACLDLLGEFQNEALRSPKPLHFRGGHWTAEGHALAAEKLAEFFAETWPELFRKQPNLAP